ncbi:hypothetical protein [Varunaivibrio sulfuroxidans]|uniref:Sulfide dehydrogenase [flavocytochrome c] flavoprotein chain central domain-containing protein n=1 Tax=Varunaivibrio sulfuroxidans TaxID=1773489 RepID=A0A4V2UNE3_9PROT|nr:hypothetical protein [Varunaivibrio sulfuroxidans]TCS61771.1 hypothetical protein EDD55_107180 [Varunaivibrio sulfuroxidans]WES32045.1 hypothetical protein P3M64_06730 [Varunaivibrio sulfuroxidans]
MKTLTRRDGLRLLLGTAAAGVLARSAAASAVSSRPRAAPRIAVIGDGIGARALASDLHGARVRLDMITAADPALAIDWGRKRIVKKGETLPFDRVVLSPGVAYGGDIGLPMAWRDASSEKEIMRRALLMSEGGVVLIRVPRRPYRFIEGPYVRAERLAGVLSYVNPRAKIRIFDANNDFPDQARRLDHWRKHFGAMVEWIPAVKGGAIRSRAAVRAALGGRPAMGKGYVVDYIPEQKAARITRTSGLADASGWCPIDPRSARSLMKSDAYVIGDAASWDGAPKTALQARLDGAKAARDICLSLA